MGKTIVLNEAYQTYFIFAIKLNVFKLNSNTFFGLSNIFDLNTMHLIKIYPKLKLYPQENLLTLEPFKINRDLTFNFKRPLVNFRVLLSGSHTKEYILNSTGLLLFFFFFVKHVFK